MELDWIFGIPSALAEEGDQVVVNQDGTVAGNTTETTEITETSAEVPKNNQQNNNQQQPDGILGLLISFFPLILMGVVFYFFLIRPQRKKDKKVKEMLAALKPGDRVTTIGGIYGTIVSVKDETITLSVGAQRTEMVFTRWAIRQVEEVSVENDGEILA